jgi:hypothetical protein
MFFFFADQHLSKSQTSFALAWVLEDGAPASGGCDAAPLLKRVLSCLCQRKARDGKGI